jgi:hypothetical protein
MPMQLFYFHGLFILEKQLEPLKTLFYSVCKIHICLRSSIIRLCPLKDRKVKVWEFKRYWRENSLLHSSVPSPSIAAARKYCPFYGHNQMSAL